jgi:predicted protein tyrosine phosphatase
VGHEEHFEETLRMAVAAGGDTATVAAVAGGLLGARWGVSAIPLEWRRRIFGWPGYRDTDLLRDSFCVVERQPWPATFYPDGVQAALVAHPRDPGLVIGGLQGLALLPSDVDAVVSLCRLGKSQVVPEWVPAQNHVEVWLADSADPNDNPHLDLVAQSVVELLVRLRGQGHRVFLHCDQGKGRSVFIGALFGAEVAGITPRAALSELEAVIPDARINAVFDRFLQHQG